MARGHYYIETYGCQMNVHDSEIISSLLNDEGFIPVTDETEADLVVINTCAIREKSQHKVYSAVGRFRQLKQTNPEMVMVVCGCVAQQEKERLLKKTNLVDLVLGTHQVSELPDLINTIITDRKRMTKVDFSTDVKSLNLRGLPPRKDQVCSFLTVMQGCSNFCSYCVVPYTRGPEQSRSIDDILGEAEWLVAGGIKEITLLGQNVNAYGNDLNSGVSFSTLLKALNRVPDLKRIRFTTSHPKDFNSDLIDALGSLDKVCEHVHLPIQSGSDSILKAMGRKYTRSQYFSKVEALRQRIPGVAITTDIIVGFPGETEQDFNDTMSALNAIRYDQIFSFKYSVRPGTAAEHLQGRLSEEVKKERLARIHELQERITTEYHKSMEGAVSEVLVEKDPAGASGQAVGRTRTNKIVNFECGGASLLGLTVNVEIIEGLKHSLRGKIANKY